MPPNDEDRRGEAPTRAETLAFVGTMLADLVGMAIRIGFEDLAYLVDIARLEAETQLHSLAAALRTPL